MDNMLVNTAWNTLVKECEWEIMLILNDDIELQEEVFETLAKLEKWQVYCPYFSRWDNFNKIYSNNWNNIVWFCFGMYKSDWKDIPSELKIYFWDNYIYEYMNKNILWGWYIHHWESKSIFAPERKEQIESLIKQDYIEWDKIISNL